MSGDDRRFARIPARLFDELEAGQITFAGLALRAFLIEKTNHRTGQYSTTLSALRDQVGWRQGDQQLRDELRALEPDFRVDSAQGRPRWTFLVQADDFGIEPAPTSSSLQGDFTLETPSHLKVTSNGHPGEEPANASAMRDCDESNFKRPRFPRPDVDTDKSGERACGSELRGDARTPLEEIADEARGIGRAMP
jgi:hypothetical protein